MKKEILETKAGAVTIMMLLAAVMLFMPVGIMAGPLEPGAAPSPTMRTLDDIHNNIEEMKSIVRAEALVAITGQTISYAVGDDGDLQAGVLRPSLRFTENTNGTVTDNLTGLVWLKNANCMATNYPGFDQDGVSGDGKVTWQHAIDFVAALNAGTNQGCSGGRTDWRLPNLNEMQSLLDYGYDNPHLSNTVGTGQWTEGDPWTEMQLGGDYYWTGTIYAGDTSKAWIESMVSGITMPDNITGNSYVWPVVSGIVMPYD